MKSASCFFPEIAALKDMVQEAVGEQFRLRFQKHLETVGIRGASEQDAALRRYDEMIGRVLDGEAF
jgi:hypothetical protein